MTPAEDVIITVCTIIPTVGMIWAAGRRYLRRMMREEMLQVIADILSDTEVQERRRTKPPHPQDWNLRAVKRAIDKKVNGNGIS